MEFVNYDGDLFTVAGERRERPESPDWPARHGGDRPVERREEQWKLRKGRQRRSLSRHLVTNATAEVRIDAVSRPTIRSDGSVRTTRFGALEIRSDGRWETRNRTGEFQLGRLRFVYADPNWTIPHDGSQW